LGENPATVVERRCRVGPGVRVDPDRDHAHLPLFVYARTGGDHGHSCCSDPHAAIKSRVAAGTEGTGLNEVRAARSTGNRWVTRRSLRDPPTAPGSPPSTSK